MYSFSGVLRLMFIMVCVADVTKHQDCSEDAPPINDRTEYNIRDTGPRTVMVCPVVPAASGIASWLFIPQGDPQDTSGDYDLTNLEELVTFACAANNFDEFPGVAVLAIILRSSSLTSGSVSFEYTSQGVTVTYLINYDEKFIRRISERTVFDQSSGTTTPVIWNENGLTGVVNLCERVDTNYRSVDNVAVPVCEPFGECPEDERPKRCSIEVFAGITAEMARPYEVVLVEGPCSSPSFMSDPVTLNVMLPPPTQSVSPSPTFSPTTNVPTATKPSPTPTPTDPSPESSDSNLGVIIGPVVAVFSVLIAIIIVAIGVLILKQKRKQKIVHEEDPPRSAKTSSPELRNPRYALQPGEGSKLTGAGTAEVTHAATENGKDLTDFSPVPKKKKRKKVIAYMPEQDTQWYEDLGKALARKHSAQLSRLLLPNTTDDQWSRDIAGFLMDPYCECVYCIYCGSIDDSSKSSSGFKRARSEIVSRKLQGNNKVFFVELGAQNTDQHTNGITTFFIDKPPKAEEYHVDECAAFLHKRVSLVLPTVDVPSVRSETTLPHLSRHKELRSSSLPSRRLHVSPDENEGALVVDLLRQTVALHGQSLALQQQMARHSERMADNTEATVKTMREQTEHSREARDNTRLLVDDLQLQEGISESWQSRPHENQDQQVHGSQENDARNSFNS